MLRSTFDPQLPLHYVRYARMSSSMQNPRSPEQQFDAISGVLGATGYSWVHVTDYRDDAVSGRLIRKRRGFCEMLDAIRTGRQQVDLILVDTFERFGRTDEMAGLRRELQTKFGVFVLTADNRFTDPTTVAGQALGFVESVRASSDAHVKGHNVRRGKLDAARQRHWPGGPAPLGYRLQSVMKLNVEPAEVDYRTLVPDPATAPVVERFFSLASEKGWGGFRIAKHLNSDGSFVATHRKVSGSMVNYVLGNPVYAGTLRFNRVTTGIVEDRRVAARNDDQDVVYIADFCEPIVPRQVFDDIQQERRRRSERIRSVRDAERPSGGKQIKPLAVGVVVRYPLTGLIRCSECGAAMRPTKSGGMSYYYYGCPTYLDGRCRNDRSVRGDWLWPIFVARLREELFPLPDNGDGCAPAWLEELVDEVRAELLHLSEHSQDRRPHIAQELADVKSRIAGWIQSLANPDLSVTVRRHIEQDFNEAALRQGQLEAGLAGLDHEVRRSDELLDVNAAIDRLRRLDTLLGQANPTALNVELARHVERISVQPDGSVIMRTHRLGLFEGLTATLAIPAGNGSSSQTDAPGVGGNGMVKPRSALLARNVPGLSMIDGSTASSDSAPLAFVTLPDKWVDEVVVRTPKRHTWAHLRAAEVQRKRHETSWSHRKLAGHFGVTIPTIRHALRLAAEQDQPQA